MQSARLTFAPTAHSSDAYYIAGMAVADAFIGIEFKGKFYAVAGSLELGNFKNHSRCHKVFPYEALQNDLPKKKLSHPNRTALTIAAALKKLGARSVIVGNDFPAGLFCELNKILPADIALGPLFPEREIKSREELNEIRKANAGCSAGIALCREQIRRAKAVKGKLFRNSVVKKEPLTSEFLRGKVQELFLRMGLEPVSDLIIACGTQACDPHGIGTGQLKARELIVVDLFAPLQKTHYWGDMTRTFIKGEPSDEQDRLVSTVEFAQREAILSLKAGITGKMIYGEVQDFFEISGYPLKKSKIGYEGFNHGLHGVGHSLGLDVHDNEAGARWLGPTCEHPIKTGEVYTVEPGLYYKKIGGCRIEDNGVVTKDGFELLSDAPYDWVL